MMEYFFLYGTPNYPQLPQFQILFILQLHNKFLSSIVEDDAHNFFLLYFMPLTSFLFRAFLHHMLQIFFLVVLVTSLHLRNSRSSSIWNASTWYSLIILSLPLLDLIGLVIYIKKTIAFT